MYIITVIRLCHDFFVQSLVTVLHTCVSIMLLGFITRFRMNLFRKAMLKHSVWLPERCFQFKYLEFHSNAAIQRGSCILLSVIINGVLTCSIVGLVARKPVIGVSDKAIFKPVSSATETT